MIQACTWSASPLLVVDPHYTNYSDLATQYGTQTVSVSRTLQENGEFSTIDPEAIRAKVKATGATAVVVIPYDNPSGQFIPQEALEAIAQVCVEENVWMVSDEAYRGLQYTEEGISSIWGITEDDVEGITGRRISIESASKLFNACGLRAGGLVTDNQLLHQQVVNLATAELCSPVLGQSALGALSEVSAEDLRAWIDGQREYYNDLLKRTAEGFSSATPGLIVSATQAAIYFVIDFRHIDLNFDAAAFARFCATTGKVDDIGPNGEAATLLTSPMNGSYMEPGAGATQLRIAGVGSERDMSIAPEVCNELLRQYQAA